MAGSVVWRCPTCKKNATERFCDHPNASYAIIYRVNNKQRWKRVGRDRREAQAILHKITNELVMGTYFETRPMRFAELTEKFLTTHGSTRLKPASAEYYRHRINALLPTFGDMQLTEITRERIDQFAAAQAAEGKVSPATINKNIGALRRLLNLAVEWGYLPKNPTEGIKNLREEHKEMDFLTPEEIQLLLKHADEPYRSLFLTAVTTGMRRGELLSLQWGDIDWHNSVIHVRRNLISVKAKAGTRVWRFVTPKSRKSVRAVPMLKELREALELHKMTAPASPDDLVFCAKDGRPLDPNNMVKREFNPTLAQAGLRRVRFHDLRHTYAAVLVSHGVNVKVIQTLLGHASIQTTLDTYGHLLPSSMADVSANISSALFGPEKVVDRRETVPGSS